MHLAYDLTPHPITYINVAPDERCLMKGGGGGGGGGKEVQVMHNDKLLKRSSRELEPHRVSASLRP
jgi:hypothetical protein